MVLRVGGVRRVKSKGYRRRGQLEWFGRVDERPVRARTYPLTLVATDLAGNRSRPAGGGVVRVRYVELVPALYRTQPGALFRGRRARRMRRTVVAARRPHGDGSAARAAAARARPSRGTTACS